MHGGLGNKPSSGRIMRDHRHSQKELLDFNFGNPNYLGILAQSGWAKSINFNLKSHGIGSGLAFFRFEHIWCMIEEVFGHKVVELFFGSLITLRVGFCSQIWSSERQ